MPLSDYSHWNEEATQVWWNEEGRFESDSSFYDDDEDCDYTYDDEDCEDDDDATL